jgi:hypothetical protein
MKLSELPLSPRGFRRRNAVPAGAAAPTPPERGFRPDFEHVVAAVLVCAVTIAGIVLRPVRSLPPYVPGQVADRTLFSEQAFDYEDPEQTRLRQEDAQRQVPPVFVTDQGVAGEDREVLALLGRRLAGEVETGRGQGVAAERALAVYDALGPEQRRVLERLALVPGRWAFLLKRYADRGSGGLASDADLESRFDGIALQYDTIQVVDPAGRRVQRALADLMTPRRLARELADEVTASYPDADGLDAAFAALFPLLFRANLRHDMGLTQKSREQARAQVQPVRCEVARGEPLLRRGERITRSDLTRLERYRQLEGVRETLRERLFHRAASILLFLGVFGCALYMLHALHPAAVSSRSHVWVLAVIVAAQIGLNRLAGWLFYEHLHRGSLLLPALLPLAIGAMLLGQLIGLRTALWAGILSSFATALCFPDSFALLVTGTLASFIAAALMRRVRRRFQVLRAGIGVGVVQGLAAVLFMQAGAPGALLLQVFYLAFASGLLCAVAALVVTPLFEYLFGLTTDHALLELSDLNHPLLKRLQLEAPGTYHHSLLVAAIAEEAAAAIGANPMLARVCAYFHDVGKLASPDYFTENAMGADPHAELDPKASAQVILRHVSHGLELAARHKLKPVIRDAIAQHHGSSLVSFFYQRALAGQPPGGGQPVPVETEFRYPGPRPVRREILIVGLADCCEAAARSLDNPTPERVRELVERLVLERLQDGQLADADMVLRDLFVVRDTIAKVLANMRHGRIRYPKGEASGEDQPVQGAGAAHPGPAAPADAAGAPGGVERGDARA